MTVSVGPGPPPLEYDEARHGQFGVKEIELSKTSEYRGREVHSGLHRHYIHKISNANNQKKKDLQKG
jgi:hypothetical protein